MNSILRAIGIVVLLFGFSACSSGENGTAPVPQHTVKDPPVGNPPDNPPPPPAKVLPTGIWHGHTKQEGRSVLGVVLPDGRSWFIYNVVGGPNLPGGVVAGTTIADGSTWTMDNATYVNTEYNLRASLDASGTWLAKQRLIGSFSLTYHQSSVGQAPFYGTDGVDLIYDTRSETAFDLERGAGQYVGLLTPPYQEALVVLSSDGSIAGLTASGCTFSGQATPNGPIAEAVVTTDGEPCANDHATVRGVLGVDLQSGKMYAAGFSQDRQQALIFIGQR